MSRAVITGTGVVSAAGLGAGRILEAMTSNENLFSGGLSSSEESERLPWPVARVKPEDMAWPRHEPWWLNNRKFASHAAHLAVAAAFDALKSLPQVVEDAAERSGVVMALAPGEEDGVKVIPRLAALSRSDPRPLATLLYDEVPDFSYIRGIPSQTGQFIAKATGFLGSNVAAYGEAGAGGLGGLALALRLLQSGELDRVIVVGAAPPSSPTALAGLDRHDPLGTEATPGRGPFDRDRRGPMVGQGAAAIMIEREDCARSRGATPLAELVSCEAICGTTLEQALSAALELVLPLADGPPDVWWAHGCGSVSTDRVECQVVGASIRPTTTSTKGTIGSAFDCAGLIDVAVAVEALQREIIPPVGLLRNPDSDLGGLDFVQDAPRSAPGQRRALITALGHPSTASTSAGAAFITRVEPAHG